MQGHYGVVEDVEYHEQHKRPPMPGRSALIFLTAFVLGGLATLIVVQSMLYRIVESYADPRGAAEVLNIVDYLLPFYLVYVSALVILFLVALSSWFAARSVYRRRLQKQQINAEYDASSTK